MQNGEMHKMTGKRKEKQKKGEESDKTEILDMIRNG